MTALLDAMADAALELETSLPDAGLGLTLAEELREARAAVAELVAASRKALPRKLHNDRAEDAALRAALAKFGGAA